MALILMVDDDPNFRDVLSELFEEEHRCHIASTAEQALSYLDSDVYDVILTDISMPGLSGVELLGHARQRQPDTPVVVISGIVEREYAEGLIKMGAYDFLPKPVGVERLVARVESAIEYRHRLLKERRGLDASSA